MKKIAILAAIAALTLSTGAQMASAQDKQLFNHASVGITAGLDGFGVEAALPASRILQIRGGYSLAPIPINYNLNLTGVSSFVPINAKFLEGGLGKVMLDIFPVKESPFRITAGAYMGSGKLAALKLDVRDLVKPQDFGKDIGQNGVSASTDKDGFGYIDIDAAKLMPYLGLGFGRAVDLEARVSFLIELGAAYTGGYDFMVYDYSNPSGVKTSKLVSAALVNDDGSQMESGIVDKVSAIPVLPMLKLGLYLRLF